MTKFSFNLISIALLFSHFTTSTTTTGPSNVTFFNEHAQFSTFELFKNTKLFYPCPGSAQASSNTLVPRRGGGRGGGGGSGGGGGDGGGGGTRVASLVSIKWIRNEADYCKALSGNVIMIPTLPTQTAFFPWWPTFVAHGVSLAVTYFGLWRTSRTLDKSLAQDMKFPVAFWAQLPFDVARIGAWYFKAIHGFTNPARFAWISVILWLVPFNYIWLIQLLRRRQNYYRATSYPVDSRNEGWKQNTPLVQEYEIHQYPSQPYQQQHYQPVAPYLGPQQPVEPNQSLRPSNPKIFFATIVLAVVTGLMWILTLLTVIKRWQQTFITSPTIQTYYESSKAVADPTLLGAMPSTCIDWLKSGGPVSSTLLDPDVDEFMMVAVTTFQLLGCSAVLYTGLKPSIPFLNKKAGLEAASPFRQTHRMLKLSAYATFITLAIPALVTGIWIIVTVTVGSQNVLLQYTNDLTQTGGCTFAIVNMNKKWGYWDVQYELPYRIIMSIFGAT